VQEVSSNTFIPPHPLKTAVLFLVFNRPDTTKQVFDAIRKAKPPKLYVAADGSRSGHPGDAEKCLRVRELATDVDWECEVTTLFREQNLGCKMAVSSAIDWFFEEVEQGIILEDDCLPSQSFFWFCQELLERYRDDQRVMHISGYDHFGKIDRGGYSYLFSKYTPAWGWATWKRAWRYFDVNIESFPDFMKENQIVNVFKKKREQNHRIGIWEKVCDGSIDTWDYQWNYCIRANNALSIVPTLNLVANIGFEGDATHTKNMDRRIQENRALAMEFPLFHPKFIISDDSYDQDLFLSFIYSYSNEFKERIGELFPQRIKHLIKRCLR
jgi:hypothetical protein